MVAPDRFRAAKGRQTYGSIVRIRILCSVSGIAQVGSSFTLAMMPAIDTGLLVSSLQKNRISEDSCSH